jgi:hypothetical protein
MPDPVSWTLVESGWKVYDADRKDVGTVGEVKGDESVDIFNGLTIKRSFLGGEKYVPAEQVAEILEGEVHLALRQAQLEAR